MRIPFLPSTCVRSLRTHEFIFFRGSFRIFSQRLRTRRESLHPNSTQVRSRLHCAFSEHRFLSRASGAAFFPFHPGPDLSPRTSRLQLLNPCLTSATHRHQVSANQICCCAMPTFKRKRVYTIVLCTVIFTGDKAISRHLKTTRRKRCSLSSVALDHFELTDTD